ncbi:hypothetical protein SAMN05660964_02367, partial [Thiothrix caldifontis]
TCDLFLKGGGLRGNKPKSYALGDAKKLIDLSPKISNNLTTGQAHQLLDDPVNPEVKSAAQKRSFFSRSPQGWVVTTPRSPQPTGAAVAPQYG